MFQVLILEDEAMLRASMVRALQKLAGVEVVEAGTVGEALRLVDAHAPNLILSDIDLPDRSGVELLGELGRRKLDVPLTFISAYLKAYGSQIPPHAHVEVREKPLALEELRALVLKHKATTAPVEHAPFGVADYLQLACMGRHSVSMDVVLPDGGRGRVVVVDGVLHDAQDPLGRGPTAFQRLAVVQAATVRCVTLQEDPGPRTIQGSWEGLLLDAARVQDEQQRELGGSNAGDLGGDLFGDLADPAPPVPAPAPATPPPPVAATPPAPPPEPVRRFDDAFDDGISALLKKNHAQAYVLFEEAGQLRPGDARVAANLKLLAAMGFGKPAAAPPKGQ